MARTFGPTATTCAHARRFPIWAVAGMRIPPLLRRSPSDSIFTRMRSFSILMGSLSAGPRSRLRRFDRLGGGVSSDSSDSSDGVAVSDGSGSADGLTPADGSVWPRAARHHLRGADHERWGA